MVEVADLTGLQQVPAKGRDHRGAWHVLAVLSVCMNSIGARPENQVNLAGHEHLTVRRKCGVGATCPTVYAGHF